MSLIPLTDASATPRVVIVDADRRVQQSLAEVLRITGEVEVVGRAGDVRAALELVERERPSVLVLDPRLPDVSAGTALVNGVLRAWPRTRIVLTGWNEEREQPTLVANCDAYVSKSATPEEFVAAVV